MRTAYATGDLLPGLPTADGALADAKEVHRDLAAGQPLWVARDAGRLVGTVRAVRVTPELWEIRRLAVDPTCRRTGAATTLVHRLEAAAAAAGAREVALDAVVERGNPAFYARLGYRTVRHFGAADKPLSEVHMRRALGARLMPVPHDAAPVGPGLLLEWRAVAGGTSCWSRLLASGEQVPAHPKAIGADFWPGATSAELAMVQRALTCHDGGESGGAGGETLFVRPAVAVDAFCRPRQRHPRLLAWWRRPPARTSVAV
ncbi:GNAT family N-acetyltransferase [Streptomyces apocyni]|uniref:GNAT family N-acetyltransferase n=1 Tax=Streptomyces apocyni TaxID=2654677 RepID=UPI0018D18242|nr:GNAT family N-acetyltransferase [Streptomyces apocyni]